MARVKEIPPSLVQGPLARGFVVTDTHTGSKLPRLRSGFRQPAQTPAKRLNFECVRLRLTALRMTDRRK